MFNTKKFPSSMTPEEEKMWFCRLRAQNGDYQLAFTTIVERNYGLVGSILVRSHVPSTAERRDGFTAGVMGLIKAVEKFDLSREVKFSTYATWYISREIRNCFLNETHFHGLFQIPSNQHYNLGKLKQFANEKGVEVDKLTIEEIGKRLNCSVEAAQTLLDTVILQSVDIDKTIPGTTKTIAETIGAYDSNYDQVLEEFDRRVTELLQHLSPLARQIITLYFLEDMPIEVIALELGVSNCRVMEIHRQALLQLRRRARQFPLSA